MQMNTVIRGCSEVCVLHVDDTDDEVKYGGNTIYIQHKPSGP